MRGKFTCSIVSQLIQIFKRFLFAIFRKDIQNEYRKNFKTAFQSEREKFGFEHETSIKIVNKVVGNGYSYDAAWYKEVLELRKKAGEYRVSTLIKVKNCATLTNVIYRAADGKEKLIVNWLPSKLNCGIKVRVLTI